MTIQARRTTRGFTLIEVMIVVTLIGVLSSIAIPVYNTILYRSRIAERDPIMRSIAKAVEDYSLNSGAMPGNFVGLANPVAEAALGPTSHQWVRSHGNADQWGVLPMVVDGATYCTYSFAVDQGFTPTRLYVRSACDIDGDTNRNVKVQVYEGYGDAFVLNSDLSVESDPRIF